MIIGTAGHIDHGKTTLVKALTGVDADRLPEEKARGITLDLGYAYTTLSDGSVLGFVDMPGHEKLIHNMLAGATGIDFVLLVIAADDGPMPQTREHLDLLDLLGLTQAAVALTKIDAVSPQRLAQATQEVHSLLAHSALAGCPVFPLSGRSGQGVPELRQHLEQAAATFTSRSNAGRFRLAIDRCFTLTGTGTVVTGTAHSGSVSVGDNLMLAPLRRAARVRSLHVQDRAATHGQAGDRCALAIAGDFEKSDVTRGMWLVDPAMAVALNRFHASLRVPLGQPALQHWQAVHVHLGAIDLLGRVALLDCTEVQAGGTALAEIILEHDTLAVHGDRFILRDAGAQRTVAGGQVLDIFPPTRHKRTAARLALLQSMRLDDPALSLQQMLASAPAGIDLGQFALNWNLGVTAASALWQRLGLRVIQAAGVQTGFSAAAWQTLQEKLLHALAQEHERAPDMPGVERERLRRMTLATLARGAFDALLGELIADLRVLQTRTWLHLPAHHARISVADRGLLEALKPLLDASPFNPPRVRDVFLASGTPEETVRQLFRRGARLGELYPVAHDHYFTATAVASLAQLVQTLCQAHGAARAAALRDRIGGGRKVAIHILEFFDRVGYTRRIRDDHLIRPEAFGHDWITS